MGNSPLTPSVSKGAFVRVGIGVAPTFAMFQYNPDSIVRSLEPANVHRNTEAQSCTAARSAQILSHPTENISFTLELDASDDLERGSTLAAQSGIAPALAALEMLITPSKVVSLLHYGLLKAGVIVPLPPPNALTLLYLGRLRVLPVKINNFEITEEAFDEHLNPIRAKVLVKVSVLGPNDVDDDFSRLAANAHQFLRESLALTARAGNTAEVLAAL
jgi:hypothetical protein